MNPNSGVQRGAFTIFGYTQEIDKWTRKLSRRLAISPRTIDFGNAGHFFCYTSYGDMAETEQALALKLGFVRSTSRSPLSARQLLNQKIATPGRIETGAIRGNYLAACFSKAEARFTAYKNPISLPQLYYWAPANGEFIAADNLGCLAAVLDRLTLDETLIPFHFLFRHTPGPQTYFKDVRRLFPGQMLAWKEGAVTVTTVQDLRFTGNGPIFERVDTDSVNALHRELDEVIAAYINDIRSSGHSLANLLSGGVDSSLLQLILNEQLAPEPARSFSFYPERTPSFEFEVEYARQASALLKTSHTFATFTPEEYPEFIIKAVEILGQPVLSDVEPGKLALACFLAKNAPDIRFFFVAQGADTLFGLGVSQRLKGLEIFRKTPGGRLALTALGTLLKPFSRRGQTLLKGAAILSGNPHLFFAPVNTIAVYSNLEIARRAFGDKALKQAFEYRRSWEEQYLNTSNYTEKVHIVDLLSDTYEIQVQSSQLFQANNKEQIYPFMDEDIIRFSLAFKPEVRYIKGFRTKPLLKDILEQNGLSQIARRRKGGSVFTNDLYAWMKSGPLHELIREIDLPGFISKTDFEALIQKPDRFLWSLLTYDIFQKKILRGNTP